MHVVGQQPCAQVRRAVRSAHSTVSSRQDRPKRVLAKTSCDLHASMCLPCMADREMWLLGAAPQADDE